MKYLLPIALFFVPLLLLNCQPPKELTAKIDAQAEEIQALKSQISSLTADFEALKAEYDEHIAKFHPTKVTKPGQEIYKPKPPTPPKPPVKKKEVKP